MKVVDLAKLFRNGLASSKYSINSDSDMVELFVMVSPSGLYFPSKTDRAETVHITPLPRGMVGTDHSE